MSRNDVNRKTISYAYLSQAKLNSKDLIGGIATIFRPIAKEHAGENFKPEKFSEYVKEMYGLDLHPWAAEDLIPRLVDHGVLDKVGVVNNVVQYRFADIEGEFNDVKETDIEKVSREFLQFSKPILKTVNIDVDEDKLLSAFYSHLVDLDFLFVAVRPRERDVNEVKDEIICINEENLDSKLSLLSAGFVLYAYHQEPELYDLVLNIVSGAMVAEVVLNFGEPAKNVDLKRLTVFLDTPFLMAYMDLSSEKEHIFAVDLCERLMNKGASLKVFDHSVDELKDNLKAVRSRYADNEAWGATARRLRNPSFAAYLDSVRDDVLGALEQYKVKVSKGIVSESSQKYFSDEQEKEFFGVLGPYQNALARERDAKSLTMLMRYRNGNKTHLNDIHKLGYLFLTENSFLPDRAWSYLYHDGKLEDKEFPPMVSGRYLAGLIWVVFGGGENALPKELLLANCAAALEPKNDVLKKMLRFLEKMEPAQAQMFNQMMGEARAGQYLMQYSLGDADVLTDDNSIELMEKVMQSLIENHKAEEKQRSKEQEKIHSLHIDKVREEVEEKASAIIDEVERKRLQAEEKSARLNDELFAKDVAIRELEDNLAGQQDELKYIKKEIHEQKVSKIKEVMKKARSAEKRMEIYLLVFIALVVFFLTSLMPVADPGLKIICQLLGTFIALLTAWRVPDIVLTKLTIRYRNYVLKKIAEMKDINFLDQFSIDWDKFEVQQIKAE